MQSPRPDVAKLIEDAAASGNFHGAVRVRVAGETVYEGGFGFANRELESPSLPTTAFGIASGTKFLTALGVGLLIDDGAFSLSSRLVDLIPTPLPGIMNDVTVGHLLTHTSGVYDYYDEDLIEDFDSFELAVPVDTLLRPADYLPMILGRGPKFEPGARFSYSNSGYVLLGHLIEARSGMSFHQFLEQRVLSPCQMAGSGFFRFDALPSHAALGYVERGGVWTTNERSLPIIGGPDGGLFSTVADIERLWLAFLGENLLSTSLTETFAEPANHEKDETFYGHGVWLRCSDDRQPRLFLEGSDAGVSFKSICHSPETIATVVSNTSAGAWPMSAVVERLIDEASS